MGYFILIAYLLSIGGMVAGFVRGFQEMGNVRRARQKQDRFGRLRMQQEASGDVRQAGLYFAGGVGCILIQVLAHEWLGLPLLWDPASYEP